MISNKIRNVVQARLGGFDSSIQEINELDHSSTNGNLRESLLKGVLSDILPRQFSIRSGFICDLWGGVSPQLDIIVIDNESTPELVLDSDVAFVPVEAALIAIEVKAILSTGEKGALAQVEKQCAIVANLKRGRANDEPMNDSLSVPFMLFAFDNKISLDTLKTWFSSTNGVTTICLWRKLTITKTNEGIGERENDGSSEELLEFCSIVALLSEQIKHKRGARKRNTYRYLQGLPDDWPGNNMG